MIFDKIWNFLVLCGPTAIPLSIISIISLAVIIERAIFFLRYRDHSFRLIKKIELLVAQNDILGALNELKGERGPNAKLLAAALSHHKEDPVRIREVLQAVGEDEIRKMEKNLAILDVAAMIAPLLGLLGTVLGIISSFNIITGTLGMTAPDQISGGIAAALISTAFGLIIAIPSAIFYSYFTNLVSAKAHEMNLSVIDIMDIIVVRGEDDVQAYY
ncbi:MAG TPA: MotA/TolQ/ExbB proton channel family protein [Halanaerobiaceae bacterium]|jgi:biopolymer transport protein ExbB|nr:MotA/TolQ/ExbB proton channel family protein [Halanaerobiaceae bacterium]HOA41023.1 MotA/TolQ/ExbB proton channel family protein [Halanaerobiales bacterium]HPZ63291.1 MotA/TolQ/ExbB proton channel family protein [Halanaerobiales bacterium]HQD04542.1 MotA/TolQ/ExbB proton channel family protein [Halanaerobiales bacterium]